MNDERVNGSGVPSEEDSKPYRWKYKSGSKNSPSTFTVIVKAQVPCDVTISREGVAHRVAKKYGISKELQTGDPTFDKDYYIDTYAPKFAASFLSDPYKRDAINDIMGAKFDSVELKKDSVNAVKSPASLENNEAMEALAESVWWHVARLTENIPMASEAEMKANNAGMGKFIPFYAIPVSLFIFGWLPVYLAMENHRPIDEMPVILDTLKYSSAALALFIGTSYIVLRGTSSAGRHLLRIFLISLGTFYFFGWGAVMYVNGALDENKSVSHIVRVINKSVHRGGDGPPSYYMHLKTWRQDFDEIEIQIDEGFYNRLEPKKTNINMVTRAGWLGHEWTVFYDIAKE
ncbi:MAG: hypothetical protein OEZ04_05930 [Nitrospinota bacterium]|nr:hypothetical protein [Nitrospinota bacterium]